MAADRVRPLPAAALAAAACLPLVVALGACGSSDANPATARRERVETRLRDTYSVAQVRCVLGRLDAATIEALGGTADLAPSSAAFRRYSSAVRACVVPPETTTTTSGP